MNLSGFYADIVKNQDDEARTDEARVLYNEIIEDLPEHVELVYVEYDDKLQPEQIVRMLEGTPEFEIDHLDEWYSDSEWSGLNYLLTEIEKSLDPREWDLIRDYGDGNWTNGHGTIVGRYTFWEQLVDELRERDTSSPFEDLMRHTPAQWMRYDLTGDPIFLGDTYEEAVATIYDHLGVEPTPELTEEITAVLVNSNAEMKQIYVLWCDDVDEYVKAAYADDDEVPEKDRPTTITWNDPFLLLTNPYMGDGWAERIHCTITKSYKRTDLELDVRGCCGGYSFTDEVCGGWSSDNDTECKIETKEPVVAA